MLLEWRAIVRRLTDPICLVEAVHVPPGRGVRDASLPKVLRDDPVETEFPGIFRFASQRYEGRSLNLFSGRFTCRKMG